MEYLLAKQDLATLSRRDLAILSDYLGIDNKDHNDKLWLMALSIHRKHSKMPRIESLKDLPHEMLFETMKDLDPSYISFVCNLSKELNTKICRNDDFWQKYITYKFPNKIKDKRKFETWEQFAMVLFPIKPLTYAQFGKRTRPLIRAKYPGIPPSQVNIELGKRWTEWKAHRDQYDSKILDYRKKIPMRK